MIISMNAVHPYGFGLPKFSQTDKVQSVATLSKWQQGWRIKHPQADKTEGKFVSNSPITGTLPVIYPYLGACTAKRGRIADIQRIRTISTFANSETEARQRLAGLPLVFMSRSPAQEVAA